MQGLLPIKLSMYWQSLDTSQPKAYRNTQRKKVVNPNDIVPAESPESTVKF